MESGRRRRRRIMYTYYYYMNERMTHINNNRTRVSLFADYLLNTFSRHRTAGAMVIIGTSVIRTGVLKRGESNKNGKIFGELTLRRVRLPSWRRVLR